MNKNKRNIITAFLCFGVVLLSGCGNENAQVREQDAEKMSIVCTTYPQYDWVREILGEEEEEVSLTLLLKNGSDLHNYQPTAEDIAKIGKADVFVYIGGESDHWVEDALKEAINKDMKRVNLFEILGDAVKEEELIDGMQDEEHEHDHEEAAQEEYDEHVWLSLKNAEKIVEKLTEVLSETDTEHAKIYQENGEAYLKELTTLDKEYEKAVENSENKTILFADRFPFRYLTEDYQIEYFAAFAGCSAETEASFETVTFLSEKLEELQLKHILVLENSDQKIAELIRQNTTDKDQEILVLNSLQSVMEKDMQNGFTYLEAMKENLETLKKALEVKEG